MNKLLNKLVIILGAAALVSACDTNISPSVDDFEPSAGDADFSTFVTVGDSLTAAIADGALYRDAQLDSYPAILAGQFAEATAADIERGARARGAAPSDFTQPLMPKGATGMLTYLGGDLSALGVRDRLVAVASGDPDIPVTPDTISPTQSTAIDVPLPGPFQNMGVPSAKSFHLLAPGYGNPAGFPSANPYFTRFASDPATASIMGDVVTQAPTFFVLWIGNNDILSYATSGGTGTDQNAANNTNPNTYGPFDITDDVAFAGVYSQGPGNLISQLTALPDTQGVLATIPKVTSISFFTTVPYDAVPLTSGEAETLTTLLANPYNAGLDAALNTFMTIDQDEFNQRRLVFQEGQNPVLISDETLTNLGGIVGPDLAFARPATAEDLILLTASSLIGVESTPGDPTTSQGVTEPLPDSLVLIPSELDAIETARAAFNATIEAAANADDNLVLFDAAAVLEELATTGINYGSGGVSSAFIQGGAVSLDGIHPTSRGYAVVANEMIEVINEGFNANVAPVDPNQFSTIFYQ